MEEKAGNLSQARLAAAIVLRTTCSCGKELRQISYLLFVSQGIPSWPGMVALPPGGAGRDVRHLVMTAILSLLCRKYLLWFVGICL